MAISHSTCLSMVRNVSNAVILQNVTAEERNWKSTYFVTTPMTTKCLPKSQRSVLIFLRCLGSHSPWDATLLCARKNPSEMEAVMLEMTSDEREYPQKLEMGETVSTLLHADEHLSEVSLSNKYKRALKMYRQSQVQNVPVYEYATHSSID